jgi:L-malate glycosyltransferase
MHENKKIKKKKILIVCPYPENVAPSQRLKFEQYYTHFEHAGYKVDISPFISSSFWKIIYRKGHFFQKAVYTFRGYLKRIRDIFQLKEYDIIYVHLWVTPFGLPFFEWIFRMFSRRLIYDIDDLVYLKGIESKAHPVVTAIKGRKKPLFLMKVADHVITCTPYLDDFVRQYNKNTTDISSTVDTQYRYIPSISYKNDHILTIGWSGSLSTSKYFYFLGPVLQKLATQFHFKVLVMGDPAVKIEGVDLEAVSWTEENEIKVLEKFDIGVYPLPHEQWVYGKSGLKAIQYMAFGTPTVATAIGANFRVIENGISGFLVTSEDEWIAVLSKLIKDAELRRTIGMAGRRRVEELFSIEANKMKYLKVLN